MLTHFLVQLAAPFGIYGVWINLLVLFCKFQVSGQLILCSLSIRIIVLSTYQVAILRGMRHGAECHLLLFGSFAVLIFQ